jgi:formate hydrogenlyase subunit 6/NADH:ubiquinone oxidoreductase subunit I
MLSWWRFFAALGVLTVFFRVYTSSLLSWSDIRAALMNLQFTGALMSGGLGWAAVFAGLFVAGLLGRWYCSLLCPFGTLQETVWRAAGLFAGKYFFADKWRKTRYVAPWRFRGIVSILAGVGFLFVIPEFFILTDPISNFGRGVKNVHILLSEGFSAGAGVQVWVMAAFFASILAFSATRGRRFCDWCPVGTLLGVCSRAASVKMRLRKDLCVSCGACERACPMNCIDSKNKTLDGDRCVLCLSCAGHCAVGALSYRSGSGMWGGTEKEERRAFLRDGGLLSAIPGLFYLVSAVSAFRSPGRETPSEAGTRALPVVLPPGAGDVGSFFARCVGCQACAAACPAGIVRADDSPHPRLDYIRGYCQYNCTECSHVCPTHALRPLGGNKQRTRIGLSELTRSRCVVVTRGQSCGACAEVCPTHALRMEPLGAEAAGGGTLLTVPVFDSVYCIGCGGCFHVCPAEPRAFVVAGVTPQVLTPGVRAAEKEEDFLPSPPPVGADGEFPF